MNSWESWSNHVIEELKRFDEQHEKISNKLEDIRVEVAMLKVKASIWGSLAGLFVGTVVSLVVKRL